MDLNQLANFMYGKRQEFEESVGQEAKKLSLTDVTSEIQLDTWPFVDGDWLNGQRIELPLYQGCYTAVVDRDTLVLRGSYGIKVAEFSGDEVKKYYEHLSATILKAKQEYLKNLPF